MGRHLRPSSPLPCLSWSQHWDDQYISLSPTESPAEDADMDSGAATTGNAAQEQSQQAGRGLTRMPAVTPRLPGPKGVNFQQFCDQLWTDLPGDHYGRESFDTSARFVVGDPGARFGSAAPLEYEVTEEIGRPHWELIFEHVLRHCGYLIEFHTVYVMVDNRDLANHKLFFSCIAVLVLRHCRSTTGKSEERKQISPKAKANKNKHTNQTKQHPQKPNQAKIQGNLQTRWNRWNVRVPLKPLTSSLPPSSIAPRCPCLDVFHINVCTRIPRRVSNIW